MAEENRQRADIIKIIKRYHRLSDPWKGANREWRIQCHGKRLKVRSYGLCHWSKVIFLWENGREFYKLTRNMKILAEKGDKDIPRREYFRGRLIRRYIGLQNCFVEFCEFLWKHRNYPTSKRFSLAAQALRLDKKTTNKYINFYQQCFCPKNK